MNRPVIRLFFLMGLSAVLTGCGGGENGGSGTLSLGLTDAPVDGATEVSVRFTGVAVKPAGGAAVDFDYDAPRDIDLLALQNGNATLLLEEETLPAGRYEWIRLKIESGDGTYMVLPTGRHTLFVPSGEQSGLKLVSGFTVPAGGHADFTVDFDLRKSIVARGSSGNDYILKPALRIVDNTRIGVVEGQVDATLLTDARCTGQGDAVYVFAGAEAAADDLGSSQPPLTSATVRQDENGDYVYRAAFLNEGDYTLALTCQADLDDPEQDDDLAFVGETRHVTVAAGGESRADF